jgi:hypothetical protein
MAMNQSGQPIGGKLGYIGTEIEKQYYTNHQNWIHLQKKYC